MWWIIKTLCALSLAGGIYAAVEGIDVLEWLWAVFGILGLKCYRQWCGEADGGHYRRGFGGKPPRYHFR